MSLADKIKAGEAIITLKKGNSLENNELIIPLSRWRYRVQVLPQVDGKNLTIRVPSKCGNYYGERILLNKIKEIKYSKWEK